MRRANPQSEVIMEKVFIIVYYDENDVEHIADFVFSDYLAALKYANNLKKQKFIIVSRMLID